MEAWKQFTVFVFAWAFFNTLGLIQVRNGLGEDMFNLADTLSAVEARLTALDSSHAGTSSSVSELSRRVDSLEEEFNSTIASQRKELETLQGEFQGLESQLDTYFDWFKENSRLTPELAGELYSIEDCVGGTIRLPCIWFRDKDLFGIDYLPDADLGKADIIQNISFTVERKGGDCEDLATLFMAEANYLFGKYNRKFEAWNYSVDGNYQVMGTWWLRNAAAHGIEGTNVYVACYSSVGVGHCINAFCEGDIFPRIKRGEDVAGLMGGCTLVEPENYGELFWVDGNSIGGHELRAPFLGWMILISSEDLCADVNGTWKCFTNFRERVRSSLEVLSALE